MMKHRHLKSIGIALVLCLSLLSGCAKPVQMANKDENVILCTTFAAYDWVREILGDTDTFTCRMLVDNGVDLHSYQPSAQDIMKIANCRMLVYVGGESDTWVSDALVESGNENIVAISLLDLVGNRALNEVELEGVENTIITIMTMKTMTMKQNRQTMQRAKQTIRMDRMLQKMTITMNTCGYP